MGDHDKKSPEDMAGFAQRLNKAQSALIKKDSDANSGQGATYGFALRLATDLIAGLGVGFGIGWGLDYLLGTKPWFLLVFIVLGMAAGIVNVIRAASSKEAMRHMEATSGEGLPSVPYDDDDD